MDCYSRHLQHFISETDIDVTMDIVMPFYIYKDPTSLVSKLKHQFELIKVKTELIEDKWLLYRRSAKHHCIYI